MAWPVMVAMSVQDDEAVMAPPHLKALFPFDVTVSAWDAANQ